MKILKKLLKNKVKIFSSIKKLFDKHPIIKFGSILILVIVYFLFASRSHGIKDGFLISIITWSFFVLCTPIADGGMLIDFPIRLITGIKMIYSEIVVWIIAGSLNFFVIINNPSIYDKTILLSLFKHIIETPFPYGMIIILSLIGTFLSIYIADDLINPKKQKKKYSKFLVRYKITIFIFLILMVIILYDFLLNKLGVQIPLI